MQRAVAEELSTEPGQPDPDMVQVRLERTADLVDALLAAAATATPEIFAQHLVAESRAAASRGVPGDVLRRALTAAESALASSRDSLFGKALAACFACARPIVEDPPPPEQTRLGAHGAGGELALAYLDCLLRGDRHEALRLVREAADGGLPVRRIYLEILQPTQHEIGRLWQENQIGVATEHFCTAVTQLAMSQLYPRLFGGERNGRNMVAACVGGDLHEIGLRMVADFFEIAGWDTYFLGANTPAPSVVAAAVERRADLVAISATMSSHVAAAAELIARVRAEPALARTKIVVGGHPFGVAPELARRIGADATASDADQAIAVADALCAPGA